MLQPLLLSLFLLLCPFSTESTPINVWPKPKISHGPHHTDPHSSLQHSPSPSPPSFIITVVDHSLPYETHNIYSITFDSNPPIQTPSPLLIGLDIEWRPNFQRGQSNPAAVLQLYINNRCLVFQILHSPFISDSLLTFLANPNNRFVGVGIKADVEKLLEDYNIIVTNFVDLRNLAADVLNDREMLRTGIKSLAQRVIEKSVQKPKRVSMSRWDNVRLNA